MIKKNRSEEKQKPDENQCCGDEVGCGCKGVCHDDLRKEKEDAASEGEGCKCGCGGQNEAESGCGCRGQNEAESGRKSAGESQSTSASADAGLNKQPDPEEEALNLKYMRLMADFQNYKRRTEKEKMDTYAYANEKIVSELLNVIDNFERALAAGDGGDSFVQGMNMIFVQLQGVLEKAGVAEIESLGQEFDPNFHDAVMTEDSAEYESGKVTEVLQKGYTLNGKVVRPAMVKVAN